MGGRLMGRLTGYQRMGQALAQSVLSRPRTLWERLTYPMLREAYKQGFQDGYGTGHIDGQCAREEES
jgi:hypothetical protein